MSKIYSVEEKVLQHIEAGVNILQIISYETQRIYGIVNEAAKKLKRDWYAWNRIEGLKKWNRENRSFDTADDEQRDPAFVLDFFIQHEGSVIIILENFHPDLREDQVQTIQRLRNIALMGADSHRKTLILTQPFYCLPKDLEKEVQVIELPLPSLEDLKVIFEQACEFYDLEDKRIQCTNRLLKAALGLTIMEARIAFSKAIVAARQLTEEEIPFIVAEKENIIRKSGFLEYYDPQESLADVGGLEILKEWLERRALAFGEGAQEYGLENPKGVLLLGLPGTGKSLSAKAIAQAWKFPLLKLDMGKIFGGIVGESERNIRAALLVAEAIAPCVLWIDEIEKGMSGLQSSGASDGGTTSRVLGTFLTWMQEKTKPVFVVATANNISQLPPELLRKGRVDEIFFVDLPGMQAREEILKIHIQKKKRDPKKFGIRRLASISQGFSGAELEAALKDALYQSFYRGEEPSTEDIAQAIEKTYPLSRTMSEMITSLRQWAKTRAVYASTEEAEELVVKDKKIPKLPQEYSNPFIRD